MVKKFSWANVLSISWCTETQFLMVYIRIVETTEKNWGMLSLSDILLPWALNQEIKPKSGCRLHCVTKLGNSLPWSETVKEFFKIKCLHIVYQCNLFPDRTFDTQLFHTAKWSMTFKKPFFPMSELPTPLKLPKNIQKMKRRHVLAARSESEIPASEKLLHVVNFIIT